MKVVFLAPNIGIPGSFYEVFSDCLGVVAPQIGCRLEIVDGSKERDLMVARGREILTGPAPPDYLLLVNYMNVGDDLLPLSAEAGVGTFFVVEGMDGGSQVAYLEHTGAREAYLGEIVPDDVEAGRLLAEILTGRARQRGLADASGMLRVGILAGETTQAGKARFRGWRQVLAENDDVEQAAFAYGGWEEDVGESAARLLLQTAPEMSVIWCANDSMALGALAAAILAGRHPGEDILIGGVDLMDRALEEVEAGALAVSIGGHLIDGVRALVLLRDHHGDRGTRLLEPMCSTTRLVAVESREASRYLDFIKNRGWRDVDFSRFPSADDLSLQALLSG